MSDKELEEYINKIEPNFDSHLEKGTIEMSDEYYNLLEEKMVRLINKNQELKKQLEEWNHHLKCSKEMLDLQGHNGNYNYDSYMLGIYNGMEYIIALFETREPIFKSGKDIEFISDKTQQKDFISYLENEKNRLIHEVSHYYTDSFDRQHVVNEDVYDEVDKILNKFKEIIGNDINVGSNGGKDE